MIDAQGGEKRAKYGNGLIKEYSKKLTEELGKGYNPASLKRMRKFFLLIQKGAALRHLSWIHYRQLLSIKDINQINYYIQICEEESLSTRELQRRIKAKEYERLSIKVKDKLVRKENIKVQDFIKNPIIINNKYNYEEVSEKVLKTLILEDIDKFLKELGEGFSYIGNEYKIKIGSRYNYIDLLLFNYKYNCFVVVELKVSELKKEHIGQIQVYMNYIDENLKKIYQNKTISIIVCYKNNEFIIEYSSDNRIVATEYQLT